MTITFETAKETFRVRDDFTVALQEVLENYIEEEFTLDVLKPVAEELIRIGWVDLS